MESAQELRFPIVWMPGTGAAGCMHDGFIRLQLRALSQIMCN